MYANQRSSDGSAAENFVEGCLERSGYTIIERNWRVRQGEIDIIALDGDVLVFVEVRSRKGDRFGTAEESVTAAKLDRIVVAGLAYLEENSQFAEHYWRIDLVAVTLGRSGAVERYNHYKNIIID